MAQKVNKKIQLELVWMRLIFDHKKTGIIAGLITHFLSSVFLIYLFIDH